MAGTSAFGRSCAPGQAVVLNPGGDDHYRFSAFGLTPLEEKMFDLPGTACRFDLDEIKKLLD